MAIPLKPMSLADVRRSLVSVAPDVSDPAGIATTLHEWTGGLPRLLAGLLESHAHDGDFVMPAVEGPHPFVDRFLEGLDMDEMDVLGGRAPVRPSSQTPSRTSPRSLWMRSSRG